MIILIDIVVLILFIFGLITIKTMIILDGISVLIIFISGLIIYLAWQTDLQQYAPRISFKTFYNMYLINPEAFHFHKMNVRYKHDILEFQSFIDVIKYLRFNRQRIQENVNAKRNEFTMEMLQSFQQDIEDYKEQRAAELKKYSDDIVAQAKESAEKYDQLRAETIGTVQRGA